MKVISLGSGSRGNATLVEIAGKYLLIDNGFSLKEIVKRCDISLKDICAVLLTHEHSDHLAGVGALAKEYSIPVYLPQALKNACEDKLLDCDLHFHNDAETIIEGVRVTPFRLPHDAKYTVGYKLVSGEESFASVTDLGEMRENIISQLKGVKCVQIESNYDPVMLIEGSYPEALKKRISGRLGHLSNEDCAKATKTLIDGGAEQIILAHVSENNNAPELAYVTTAKYLEKHLDQDLKIKLGVAEQNKVKLF